MLKKILMVVGVLALLLLVAAVGGVFLVLSQLNSDATREKLRTGVSQALGTEIRIAGHKIGLLGSAEVDGLVVPNAPPNESSPLLSLGHAGARINLWSVFKGKPVVKSVEIRDLQIEIHQNGNGSIDLPFKTQTGNATDTPKQPSTGSNPEAAGELQALEALVESVSISKSGAKVFDPDNKLVASVQGLGVEGSARWSGGKPSADLRVEMDALEAAPGIRISRLRTPLQFTDGQVTLPAFTGSLAGGTVGGKIQVALLDPGRAFETTLAVKDSAVGDLLRDLAGPPDLLTGTLQLDFQGNGTLNAPKDLGGQGTLDIKNPVVGKLKNFPVPGILVGIPPLQTGEFDSLKGNYRIAGQKVLVDELHLVGKGVKLHLNGEVGFDKQLNLKGRLKIDSSPVGKVADIAQGFLKGLLGGKKKEEAPPENPDTPASATLREGIPFSVTGPSEKPVIRPEGGDPFNIIPMVAKTLGFDLAPSTQTATIPEDAAAPTPADPLSAPATPAPESVPVTP
ncbi:MAG: AsmA-like C-terminal region-containing protein [Candidatus Methylacidiphilales bacterium]|nr:AsmA-like C-terminal region-containing protein [Candidatus Methylacidiphilales bacterium]